MLDADSAAEGPEFLELYKKVLAQNKALMAVNAIAPAISGSKSLEEALATALKKILAALDLKSMPSNGSGKTSAGAEHNLLSITLLEPDGKTEIFSFSGNDNMLSSHQHTLTPDEVARVAAIDRPMLIRDLSLTPVDHTRFDSAIDHGSAIVVPIKDTAGLMGFLRAWSPEPGKFTEQDLEVLNGVAEHLMTAVSNARLYAAEREKIRQLEIWAREAHHRTRNTLQMVAGLLSMPAADSGGKRTIARVLRQIEAIATVNELLAQPPASCIGIVECVAEVARRALMATGFNDVVELEVRGEDYPLRPNDAAALGIIINELVANAVEHGFMSRGYGRIDLLISRQNDKAIIEMADDGLGLPAGFKQPTSSDSGLGLIGMLAHYSLGGKLDVLPREGGTLARVIFPHAQFE